MATAADQLLALEAKATSQAITQAMRGIKRKLASRTTRALDRCSGDVIVQAALILRCTRRESDVKWFFLCHGRRGYFGSELNPCCVDDQDLQHVRDIADSHYSHALMSTPGDPAVYKALRWLSEWRTFHWLLHLNIRGVAPTSADVRERFIESVDAAHRPHLQTCIDNLTDSVRYQKKWIATFRKHWGLQFKTLAVGHMFSEDEIRERVPAQSLVDCQNPREVPLCDPHLWSHLGAFLVTPSSPSRPHLFSLSPRQAMTPQTMPIVHPITDSH